MCPYSRCIRTPCLGEGSRALLLLHQTGLLRRRVFFSILACHSHCQSSAFLQQPNQDPHFHCTLETLPNPMPSWPIHHSKL
ncbi:unnamed protein product, partial [Haemonchus placei]